jgi:copper chaperone CopZ
MEGTRGTQLARLKLRLVDASCSSCVPGIRRELEKLRGIEWVGANPILDLIFVDYDPSLVDPEEIFMVVARTGYKAVRVSM